MLAHPAFSFMIILAAACESLAALFLLTQEHDALLLQMPWCGSVVPAQEHLLNVGE
jgi:hypothetical protein